MLIDNEADSKERELSIIVQCVSGFLSLYLGQDFAILFLAEIGIIKIPAKLLSASPKEEIFETQLVAVSELWNCKLKELESVMSAPAKEIRMKLKVDPSRSKHFETIQNMVSYGTKA